MIPSSLLLPSDYLMKHRLCAPAQGDAYSSAGEGGRTNQNDDGVDFYGRSTLVVISATLYTTSSDHQAAHRKLRL